MNASNDMEAIKDAIMKYYHEGHVKADPELYRQILHEEWKFFFYNREGEFQIADRDEYMSWYNPDEVDSSLQWETEIYDVDVTGKVGAAKIRIENQNVRYIDYFNLIKIDDKWWIVNKISHGERKT